MSVDCFTAGARGYDLDCDKLDRQTDLARLCTWLTPLFAGGRVLEVACGTGYWTQFIAPESEPNRGRRRINSLRRTIE